jgi:hypothetical protein
VQKNTSKLAIVAVIVATVGILIAGTSIIRTAFAQGAILAPGQESPHRNPSQGFSPPGQVDTFPGGNPGQCISFDPRLHDNDCYAR